MKVNSKNSIPFQNIYTNRTIKRSLEFAADYGALFGTIATIGFSVARPAVIMMTPKTDKENRELVTAKSIASSVIGFLLMLGLSVPIANAIQNINKMPQKYLNNETIKAFKGSEKQLENSKGFIFASQIFKLGLGAIAAIPKAILVALGMPYIAGKFKSEKSPQNKKISDTNLTFKGNSGNVLSSGIGRIMNNKKFIKLVNDYKDSNFPMHITAITDTIATGAFIVQAKKSKNIQEERKNMLAYNAIISTGLSILGGYGLDKLLEKPTNNFIEKFKEINKGQKNLEKQILGIKIIKPILILGTIYYLAIPLISTFLADKADRNFDKQK